MADPSERIARPIDPAWPPRRHTAVVLFTLHPHDEGRRKPLGPPARAAWVYAELLDHIESVCSRVEEADFLIATPAGFGTERARALRQRGTDFGESLRLVVEDAFALGYRRVLVLGNDAPEITADYIRRAIERLAAEDRAAVLAPTRDGGYALLGLTSPCPDAFEGIDWGTPVVAAATRDRLRHCGFRVEDLPALQDIDGPRDLGRFLARARFRGLAALARRIRDALGPARRIDPGRPTFAPDRRVEARPMLRAPPAFV